MKTPLQDLLREYLDTAHGDTGEVAKLFGSLGFVAGAASAMELMSEHVPRELFMRLIREIATMEEVFHREAQGLAKRLSEMN